MTDLNRSVDNCLSDLSKCPESSVEYCKAHPAICITVGTAIFGATESLQGQCNRNGTANEAIACIDDDNIATEKRLLQFYSSQYMNSFDTQCQAEYPGGGSGGHEDPG
jgi:hypothetical protein